MYAKTYALKRFEIKGEPTAKEPNGKVLGGFKCVDPKKCKIHDSLNYNIGVAQEHYKGNCVLVEGGKFSICDHAVGIIFDDDAKWHVKCHYPMLRSEIEEDWRER